MFSIFESCEYEHIYVYLCPVSMHCIISTAQTDIRHTHNTHARTRTHTHVHTRTNKRTNTHTHTPNTHTHTHTRRAGKIYCGQYCCQYLGRN